MAVGEWDQRQLCADGACVGVIGPDGTCKVCGRAAPNWGDERNRGLLPLPDEDDDEDEDDEEGLEAEDGEDDDEGDEGDDDGDDLDGDDDHEGDDDGAIRASSAAPGGAEWTDRKLCPDGACVGVIGDDGRCQVCRRSATTDQGAP